jgi:hypothetical protein
LQKTIKERLDKGRLNMVVSKIIIDVDELHQQYLNSSHPRAQELKKNLEEDYIKACESSNKLIAVDEFIKTKTNWKEITK